MKPIYIWKYILENSSTSNMLLAGQGYGTGESDGSRPSVATASSLP